MLRALPSVLLMGCSSDRVEKIIKVRVAPVPEIAADVSRLLRKDKRFATRLQDWQHIQRVLSNGRGLDRGTRRNKPGLGMVGENNAACIALCAADGLQQRQGGKKLLSGQIRLTRVGTFTPSKRTTRTRTMARATPATGGPT
jgi:hypothetical protein